MDVPLLQRAPLLFVVFNMEAGPGQGGREEAGLLGTGHWVLMEFWCRQEDLLPSQDAGTIAYKLIVAVD